MTRLRVRELTPPGAGGVSVIRVEGPGALERVRSLAPRARLEPGAPRYARLVAGGKGLDEAVIVVLGPARLELHVHGSPPLVRRLTAQLGGAPGEARTLEERAAERLAHAPCEAGARILLDQSEGALRTALEELAELDDERARARIRALLERGRIASAALAPCRVVLAGPVNAGKSTLFNVLLGRRRVVTSAERGTTRDAIRERAGLGAYAVELIDTAGERAVPGAGAGGRAAELEAAGQALGRELRAGADLVLWLSPHGAPIPGERSDGPPLVVLRTFADLEPGASGAPGPRSLSARFDPDGAVAVVTGAFRGALRLPEQPWSPGAAVPFEPELERAVAALAPLDAGRRRARIELLLAR